MISRLEKVAMRSDTQATLGSIEVTQGNIIQSRAAMLIWGAAGCGKTTLAATSPGDKLWLSMGDNEHISVAHRKDVHIADFSGMNIDDLFMQAQSDNPFGLDQYLRAKTNIETVVLDSATALAFRALQKAVKDKIGGSRTFTPTMSQPGLSAYGGRNGIVLEVLTGILKVTSKHNVHIIITAHEADPTMTKDGNGNDVIDHISTMLGGQLINNMTWRLSEIWYMSQNNLGKKERRIAFRPTRLRKPMKTRMFSDKGNPEFILDYDADKPDKGQMTIAEFYSRFTNNNYRKLDCPGGKNASGI